MGLEASCMGKDQCAMSFIIESVQQKSRENERDAIFTSVVFHDSSYRFVSCSVFNLLSLRAWFFSHF